MKYCTNGGNRHTFDETETCFDCGANHMTLTEYINRHFNGVQADFARAQGIKPAQVTQWIRNGFIVVNHQLFSHRRDLKQCK